MTGRLNAAVRDHFSQPSFDSAALPTQSGRQGHNAIDAFLQGSQDGEALCFLVCDRLGHGVDVIRRNVSEDCPGKPAGLPVRKYGSIRQHEADTLGRDLVMSAAQGVATCAGRKAPTALSKTLSAEHHATTRSVGRIRMVASNAR
ncbi:MAG: hypothetical protein P0Y52_07815 [Candidatus Brevundimonas phytovorans]|nr:hypothetical protein [Brevundimonas sp.]WEK56464.1 MAG: hypothetical protein P0Y52_07815 [Brevundimonas sp.]